MCFHSFNNLILQWNASTRIDPNNRMNRNKRSIKVPLDKISFFFLQVDCLLIMNKKELTSIVDGKLI